VVTTATKRTEGAVTVSPFGTYGGSYATIGAPVEGASSVATGGALFHIKPLILMQSFIFSSKDVLILTQKSRA
jgi:hypothetical protein